MLICLHKDVDTRNVYTRLHVIGKISMNVCILKRMHKQLVHTEKYTPVFALELGKVNSGLAHCSSFWLGWLTGFITSECRFQLLLSFQAKFAIHKADDEHANTDTYIIECQGVGATNSPL